MNINLFFRLEGCFFVKNSGVMSAAKSDHFESVFPFQLSRSFDFHFKCSFKQTLIEHPSICPGLICFLILYFIFYFLFFIFGKCVIYYKKCIGARFNFHMNILFFIFVLGNVSSIIYESKCSFQLSYEFYFLFLCFIIALNLRWN